MMKSSTSEPLLPKREPLPLASSETSGARDGENHFFYMNDVTQILARKFKTRLSMTAKSCFLATGLILSTLYPSSADTLPAITLSPLSQTVVIDSAVELVVTAVGTPLQYQWYFNGDVIPGAVGPNLRLAAVTIESSGAYQVMVFNAAGSVKSANAVVQLVALVLPLADNFANRRVINSAGGIGTGTSQGATKEPFDPKPCSGRVGKSVWITWIAPSTGTASFTTIGSAFDSVLGIYTGTNLNTLVEVASDDDTGGHHTSSLSFNAQAGTAYQIYVGSLDKDGGAILLAWDLVPQAYALPTIITYPTNVTTLPGGAASLCVQFQSATSLTIQWYHNGQAIAGANQTCLQRSQLTEADLGTYQVSFSSPDWTWFLKPVEIQFNSQGNAAAGARNKLF